VRSGVGVGVAQGLAWFKSRSFASWAVLHLGWDPRFPDGGDQRSAQMCVVSRKRYTRERERDGGGPRLFAIGRQTETEKDIGCETRWRG
jgi:hypothetical protein